MPQAGLFSGPAWAPKLFDEETSSYCFLRQSKEHLSSGFNLQTWGAKLNSLKWVPELSMHGRLTRYTAWLVPQECTCDYSYGNSKHAKSSYPQWFAELTKQVADVVGVDPQYLNSCCANKYVTSTHDLYWHCDGEPLFRASGTDRDTFIVSLSLGASRQFGIRRKQSKEDKDALYLDLHNGDILIMQGRMQDHYNHCIFKGANYAGSQASSSNEDGVLRINLTWRFLRCHLPTCDQGRHR